MSKAILVIDMPQTCKECQIMFVDDYSYWCPLADEHACMYNHVRDNTKPDWCPLKELPEHELVWHNDNGSDYERGFNACLDMILDNSEAENETN